MLLDNYLRRTIIDLDDVLKEADVNKEELATWDVIQYPDELIYALSQQIEKDPSVVFYELFQLENPGQVRKVPSDYSLLTALESGIIYVYIPIEYRREQSKFLTDVLIAKNVFELDVHPLARFNIVGREIYKAFLLGTGPSNQFLRIQETLKDYFVLVHDLSGTLLCHSSFNQPREF